MDLCTLAFLCPHLQELRDPSCVILPGGQEQQQAESPLQVLASGGGEVSEEVILNPRQLCLLVVQEDSEGQECDLT